VRGFPSSSARSDFTKPTYEAHEAGAILGHHFAATPKKAAPLSLPQPDPAILRKAQRNDERAFAIILRMYETPVYNYVLRLVGDRALAEDLTQEVFLRVFQGLPRFSHRSKFTTWLFQVTKNRVLDELRAVERRPRLSVALEDVPPLEAIDQPVERLETIDAVWRAVNELTVDLKMALLLRDVVGLSYNEIADSLEITLATVKWRIFKAREEVQLALSREGISFGAPKKAAPATAAAAV
jgi:RNA polymerase sigma-70 factor (ECF subfamily)